MTHVEKMRFQAALKTLRGTGPLLSTADSPLTRVVCGAEEEGQAAAGTVVEVTITVAQLVLVIAVVNRLLEVAERVQRIFVIEG